MPKSSTLSLVEEEPQAVESPVEPAPEEEAHDLSPAIAQLAERVAMLESRLVAAEAYITQLASLAHSEHHMELGSNEIEAIAGALKPVMQPHTQQTIFDVLKEHYGFAPPAVRGDA